MRQLGGLDPGTVDNSPLADHGGVQRSRKLIGLAIVVGTLGSVVAALTIPKDSNTTLAVLIIIAAGIPSLWLAWRQPVIVVAGLMFLNASFIPASALNVRLGFGGLNLIDLVLLGLIGLLVCRKLFTTGLVIPWWSVSAPLALFMAMAVISALYALLMKNVILNLTFSELRPIIYYLAFFATVWSVTRSRQLELLLGSLFLIADLVAAVIILQQFRGLGNPLIESVMSGPGRSWLLWPVSGISSGFGSVRVVPAGHVLTFTMSVVAFCCLLYRGQKLPLRILFGAQVLFLNISLLLTYTRAQWIASTIAVILTMVVLLATSQHRVISSVLITLLIVFVTLGVLGVTSSTLDFSTTAPSNPLLSRLSSIFTPDTTLDTGSLQWRVFENEQAMRSIAANPVMGVGLGNNYRGATLMRQRETVGDLRFARFIHNSFLYIAVKMGLPSLLVFLWFCIAFVAGGWRNYRSRHQGYLKPITLAMLASFTGLLFWSNTQPNFILVEGTLFVGVMVGIVDVCRKLEPSGAEG